MIRLALILAIASLSPLNAQDRAAQLDSLFSELHRSNKFSGNVLIAEGGKVIFQKSYGLAFREKGEPLNSESIFELASIGKQFTAMAVMILKQQGRLSYADTLRKFFPELPYQGITIRHLLNHTSGLPDYMTLASDHWDSTKIMTNKDMIALLVRHKPGIHFSPGEKFAYSNTGYALLGSIIERVSGLSFRDFMAAHVYKPAGMKRTLVYHKRLEQRLIDNYAYGYVFDREKNDYIMADSSDFASMVYSLDGIYGDGLTNSTTTDLLTWDQALYTEKLVSNSTMHEAFMSAPLNNGTTYDYGFGWMFSDTEFGRIMFHGGGWPGYSTWIERHTRDNKTIIILANSGSGMSAVIPARNILYGIKNIPPAEIKLSTATLNEYVGSYKLSEKDTIVVSLENEQLYASGAGQRKHVMYAKARDLFFRKDADYNIQFMRNEEGQVELMRILRLGPSIDAVRIPQKK